MVTRNEVSEQRSKYAKRTDETPHQNSPLSISRIEEIAPLIVRNIPAYHRINHGGFYTADEEARAGLNRLAERYKAGRIADAVRVSEESGKLMDPDIAAQMGFKEKIARALAADTGAGMAMRGGIVGTGLTASGAGLVQLMQFLTQGTQAQAERNDVLPS